MNERPTLRAASRLRRAVTIALLAVVGTLGLAGLLPGTALAENSLVSSDPADGSTLAASPESISFTFSEPLGEVNTITLTCTDLYTVGPREVSADRLTMTAEVVDALPKGACVASFVVSDEEGSPNGQGNITFTIENDPVSVETTSAPEETGDSVPTGDVSTTAATSTSDVTALSDVDSGQGPLWLGRLLSVFGIAVLLRIAGRDRRGLARGRRVPGDDPVRPCDLAGARSIGTLLYVAAATPR